MTFWELAEKWRDYACQAMLPGSAGMLMGCADELEALAREKAKEWSLSNQHGTPLVIATECVADLGVPEEEHGD